MQINNMTIMGKKIRADMFGTSVDLPRIVEIDMTRIFANPDQPRKFFDQAALDELAHSIESKGLLQPILVKEAESGRYMIVAGERRYRAHQLLARDTIAAIITEGDIDEIAIIENVQRENLRPIELAESLAKLMQTHGYTQEEAAKIIGKARSTITELLSLLKLPDDIKEHCRMSDNASKSFLIELVRMDETAMRQAWDDLRIKGESSVRGTRAKKSGDHQEKPEKPSPFQRIEHSLLMAVKTAQSTINKLSSEERDKLLEIKKNLDSILIASRTSDEPNIIG